MALIFMDGLDCYASDTQCADGGWVLENSNTTFSTSAGRFGGGALSFTSALFQWSKAITSVAYGGVIYCGFSYKHTGTATTSLLKFLSDTSSALGTISHDAAGVITFAGNSGSSTTEAGTSLTPSAWHWIEVKLTLGTTSSNGAVEVRVNGSVVLTATSQDTNATGVGCGIIEYGGGGTGGSPAYIDDVVIYDSTGATINDFLGDTKITTQVPNGDGGTVDWTASAGSDYQCVDDTPSAANDDTDYISSSTVAQESRFDMTNLAASPTSIHAVQVRYRAKKTDAGTRTVRGLVNSNATESTGTTRGLSTTYRWFHGDKYSLNPDGSVAWTESAVNAVQVGVEVVA